MYNLKMLNVGVDVNGAKWIWESVCSPFARIYLVTKGHAEIRLDNSTLKLSEGNLYLIPPFVRHSCIGNKDFSHYYIHLYESPDSRALIFEDESFCMEQPATEREISIFNMLYTLFPDAQLSNSDPTSYDNDPELNRFIRNFINRPASERILINGAMLVLISRFIIEKTNKSLNYDSRLYKVRKYINTHLNENISIPSISEMACMSESHFIRKFKDSFGISPKQYIIKRRIERAELQLLLHQDSVKDIAHSVGFDDISLFVKTFKKMTGMTPSEYRLKNRQSPSI